MARSKERGGQTIEIQPISIPFKCNFFFSPPRLFDFLFLLKVHTYTKQGSQLILNPFLILLSCNVEWQIHNLASPMAKSAYASKFLIIFFNMKDR